MDIIVQQENQKMQTIYGIYLKIMVLCKEAIEQAMKEGQEFCIFRIPRRFEEYPLFDRWYLGELVRDTLRNKWKYQSELFQEAKDVYLWILWTEVQMFQEKRKIYEQLYKKCDLALRAYVLSDMYRIHKRKTFFYQVPVGAMDMEPYEPVIAAKFIAAVLRKRNFQVNLVVVTPQDVGVLVSWEHIGVSEKIYSSSDV